LGLWATVEKSASLEFRVGCRAQRRQGKPIEARSRELCSWPDKWLGNP
jgi:hypothetical protein